MARRIKKKQSIFAPAQDLIKKLSNTNARLRRRVVKITLWAVGIFLVYSFMSGTYGITRIVKLELERRSLVKTNHEQLVELIDAVRIREMLKDDRLYIEYIARTRYHMVRPDETIYRFRHR